MNTPDSDPASVVDVDRSTLQQLIVKLLQRKGMFAAEAEIVAERMIEANLLQCDGSGVGSLPEFLETMDLGDIDPRARLITVSESPAVAVVDGSTGMGHVAATRAMLMAVDKANAVGTGMVVIRNSRPCGNLGLIARLAADRGLIGFVTSSEDPGNRGPHTTIALPGQPVSVIRSAAEASDTPLALFCQLLSAGLAGAEPPPRKRKANHAANVVEYSLLAINLDTFGVRESLATRWASRLPAVMCTLDPTATRIPLVRKEVQMLTELAGRIKFDINW